MSDCYNDTINSIRACLKNKKSCWSIDEITELRFVINVFIGILKIGFPGKTFLLNMELLEKTNNGTTAKLFDKTTCLLYPEVIKHDDIILFVSDVSALHVVKY